MTDNYNHSDIPAMYVVENIPGPMEDSDEYKEIINNFNSQLTAHCNCDMLCLESDCNCIIKCGGFTYISSQSNKFRLKDETRFESYSIVECNSLCRCPADCGNRLVQKGPMLGLFIKDCDNISKGKGLFTECLIPKGSFICEYAGEVITKSQAIRRQEANVLQDKMNYIFCLNEYCNNHVIQTIVDPSDFGNIGRYINHSCEPNCYIVPVRVDTPIPKLAIFSCIDVLPGKEITFDYGSYSLKQSDLSKNRKKCLCGTQKCKGLLPYEKF